MRPAEFSYRLPRRLIAQYPLPERTGSRLLRLERSQGGLVDDDFKNLPGLLRPGDLLIFNDTRVIPARLSGHKQTGGKVEVLVERILGEDRLLAQLRAGRKPPAGSVIMLAGGEKLSVAGRDGEFFILDYAGKAGVGDLLERLGHIPLPPYISRNDEALDRDRYQTVYARRRGAVAAPTAGLHFTDALLAELGRNGVETDFITLHVGAGTFQPVRAGTVEEHVMHSEWFRLDEGVCRHIDKVKRKGGRVIAVGTTVVRCLETAARQGSLAPASGETDIFIYPGYAFRVIDGMITNFHLPESTLLMLVCAFAGKENTLRAYEHAVAAEYRFFSYGDAMLIM
jgi:S-adenosylmethionine:tRNA ribosyltransferase-isomerase